MLTEIANIAALIEAWDTNEPVWSVERGGLGPGYEQAIQVLVFEACREFRALAPQAIRDRVTRPETCPAVVRLGTPLGLSGAQVGVALDLAERFVCEGYRATLDDAAEHGGSLIQVQKRFPQWEDAA